MELQMTVAQAAQMAKALKRATTSAGGWTALARVLSHDGPRITKQGVWSWQTRGIPAERAVQIERVLKGAVTRDELRPDIFAGYVRAEESRR